MLLVPSLVETLCHALREEIFLGAIAGGEAVTEVGIAERYSVARPTAKAALERLVHDGLLHRSTNKSARVPLLGVADVRDLYWTRRFLERALVSALAIQRKVPESAHRFIRDLEGCIEVPLLSSVVEADIGFHRALLSQLGSPRLSRLYIALMGEVHLCMAQVQAHRLLHPAVILEEHRAIVKAIESGDQAQAVIEVDQHLDGARDQLISYLVESGSTG